jgi:hypothetical protein
MEASRMALEAMKERFSQGYMSTALSQTTSRAGQSSEYTNNIKFVSHFTTMTVRQQTETTSAFTVSVIYTIQNVTQLFLTTLLRTTTQLPWKTSFAPSSTPRISALSALKSSAQSTSQSSCHASTYLDTSVSRNGCAQVEEPTLAVPHAGPSCTRSATRMSASIPLHYGRLFVSNLPSF